MQLTQAYIIFKIFFGILLEFYEKQFEKLYRFK